VDRTVLSLVSAALAFAACAPELPRDLEIETKFDATETALLQDAIGVANRELGVALLGQPVLTYKGRYTDPDGFTFDDFTDEHHVIYLLDLDSPEYAWIESTTGSAYAGYATLGDVLMRPLARLGGNERVFHQIALHELGHFLGMTHNPDPDTIMYGGYLSPLVTTYTDKDKAAFCQIYACR